MSDFEFYGMNWYGRTSAEQREHCLRWYIEPAARLIFAANPEANSFVFAVAQFWSDEANDAVHVSVLACPERAPKWPKCVNSALFGGETYERNAVSESLFTVTGGAFGDSNYRNIVAFGSQCRPGCDQEMSTSQAYRPWAIAVRKEGTHEVESQVVGKTKQRDFEDNFNVGFSRIGEDGDYFEGAGPRLDEYTDEFIATRYRCGEVAARIADIDQRLRLAVTQLADSDALSALAQFEAELTQAITDANQAFEASLGVEE